MQLIVGPAVSVLPDSKDKKNLTDKLKKRRIPVMDGAIIVQILTAMYLVYSRWNMIISEPIMRVKALFGAIALTLAFLTHFYYRNKKNQLEKAGEQAALSLLNKRTKVMEKAVLVCGFIAYILGIYFNHM